MILQNKKKIVTFYLIVSKIIIKNKSLMSLRKKSIEIKTY